VESALRAEQEGDSASESLDRGAAILESLQVNGSSETPSKKRSTWCRVLTSRGTPPTRRP